MGTFTKTICRAAKRPQSPQKGRRHFSYPPATACERYVPLSHVHYSSTAWQRERLQRLSRICRCLDRGRAAGKRLGRMLRLHAWRWKDRNYTSDSGRRIQFSRVTLGRVYRCWRASGGDPAALALHYVAPVKIHKTQVQDFARACINSGARSFAEAYGRLPMPKATVYAYRLKLGPKLLRRVVKLFSARRLEAVRTRLARAAVNSFAEEEIK